MAFEADGRPLDLDILIEQLQRCLDSGGGGATWRLRRQWMLGRAVLWRGERRPFGGDLEQARELLRELAVSGRADRELRIASGFALAQNYIDTAYRDDEAADFDKALEWLTWTKRLRRRNPLLQADADVMEAYARAGRASLVDDDEDVEALRALHRGVQASDRIDPDEVGRLLASGLLGRYDRTARAAYLTEATGLANAVAQEMADPAETRRRHSLRASCLLSAYERSFDPADLTEALRALELSLDGPDPHDPDIIGRRDLQFIGLALEEQRLGPTADFDELVQGGEQLLAEATQAGMAASDIRLNLAETFGDRFDVVGDAADVVAAVALVRAVEADRGASVRDQFDHRLGRTLLMAFECQGRAADLDEAMETLLRAERVMPSGLAATLDVRWRLALAFRYRFELTGDPQDDAEACRRMILVWTSVHPHDPKRWLYQRWTERILRA